MENQPIRVLQIGAGPFINRGVEKFLMDIYKNIDQGKVQFDFLTPCNCRNDTMRTQIENLGGQLYEFRIKPSKLLQHIIFFVKLIPFLKSHRYLILHINTGNIMVLTICSLVAKLLFIPQIIVHSHNTGICTFKYKILKTISMPILKLCPTNYFACSKLAGKFIFPRSVQKQVIIIHNAINITQFKFCETTRKIVRKKLNLSDKFVIGHVGAFINQKKILML